MTKDKALRMALEALQLAGGNLCEALHHPKKLQHGIGEPCLAVAKYDKAITAIKEALSSPNGEAQPEPTNLERHERNVQRLFGTPQPKEPEQRSNEHLEPVAWMDIDEKGAASGLRYWSEPDNRYEVALYTTPPQRTAAEGEDTRRAWVGLDPEEIRKTNHHMVDGAYHYSFKQGAEWAEAKLKEKNT